MILDSKQTLHQARELTEAGRHDDARLCLLKLLQKEPDNQTAMIMLGGAYFSMGKLSEAEMVFERLILMAPGIGKYSIALFNTLWQQHRHQEALEEIKRFMTHADQTAEKETITQYLAITQKLGAS